MTEANELLARARAREETRAANTPRIDYKRMNARWPKQKAALTRAVNAYGRAVEAAGGLHTVRFADPEDIPEVIRKRDRIIMVCAETVREWDEIGAWPDDWALFQRALDDVFPTFHAPDLRDLR